MALTIRFMILAVGLDIIELERIERTYLRFREKFAARILSENERAQLKERVDSIGYLAGRFAAKEAALKALGALFDRGVYLRDMEVVNDSFGKPMIQFHSRLESALDGHRLHLSITHSHMSAAAVAVLESAAG